MMSAVVVVLGNVACICNTFDCCLYWRWVCDVMLCVRPSNALIAVAVYEGV